MSARLIALASVLVLLTQCRQSGPLYLTPHPCQPWSTYPREAAQDVDLLLVLDGDTALAETRAALAAELPRVIVALLSGDHDADGVAERVAARSLHVGVVSADMGTDRASECAGVGDDGVLLRVGCEGAASGVFAFESVPSPTVAGDATCAIDLAAGGRAFSQPLESALKALSLVPGAGDLSPVAWTRPGYRPPVFAGDTFGHGSEGSANGAFLRASSALALLIVTADDDCSAPEFVFARSDVPIGLRCHEGASQLRPIERYVEGLLGVRYDPSRLVVSILAGIPSLDFPLELTGTALEQALASPVLEARVDPDHPDTLLPSCTSPSGLTARPPRRLLALADQLSRYGADVSVRSICSDDMASHAGSWLGHIAGPLSHTCVEARRDAQGHLACELVATLYDPFLARCDDFELAEAWEPLPTDERVWGSALRCRARAIDPSRHGLDAGWWFDDGSFPNSALGPECHGRARVSLLQVPPGAQFSLDCYEPNALWTTSDDGPCDPATNALLDGSGTCAAHRPDGAREFTCDPVSLRCGAPCTSDDDCPVGTSTCDLHRAEDIFQGTRPPRVGPDHVRGYCALNETRVCW